MIAVIQLLVVCSVVSRHAVLDQPGVYRSQEGSSCVELFTDEAAALNLRLLDAEQGGGTGRTLPNAYDTTAFAWLDNHRIIYSTSALYGKEAGIFLYDVRTRKAGGVALPSEAMVAAASWIKLKSLSSSRLVCWLSNVDTLDEGDLEHTARRVTFRWTSTPGGIRIESVERHRGR